MLADDDDYYKYIEIVTRIDELEKRLELKKLADGDVELVKGEKLERAPSYRRFRIKRELLKNSSQKIKLNQSCVIYEETAKVQAEEASVPRATEEVEPEEAGTSRETGDVEADEAGALMATKEVTHCFEGVVIKTTNEFIEVLLDDDL